LIIIYIGDWGLGIGDWAPIPKTPNPKTKTQKKLKKNKYKIF